MDFDAVREPIRIFREVFSGSSEQPLDLDVSLPDYCPDISRILKCQATPQISARSIVGDRLTVEGSTLIRIFYSDEEKGCLRCCELNSAFSADFNLRLVPEMPAVFTETRVDFMNCRAVTKRRVDIHCAFTITAHVWGQQRPEVLTSVRGCGIRIKTAEVPISEHIGTVQQPLSVSEEFTLEADRPAPETILRFSSDGRITDARPVAGKMMLKGELRTHVLYSTDAMEGKTDIAEFTIPFSQIVDMDELDDSCECENQLELLSTQVQLNDVEGTGQTAFEVEIRGALCITAVKNRKIPVILDAYSTDYETDLTRETIQLRENGTLFSRSLTAKGLLPDSSGMMTVLDCWSEPRGFNVNCRDGKLEIIGRVCIALLMSGEDGHAAYQEILLDLADSMDWANDEAELNPQLRVENISYRLSSNGQMEIRAEIAVESGIRILHKRTVATRITPDEQRPKVRDTTCAMTLYYAQKGETVWDIARRYDTAEEAIRAENDLKSDCVEDCGMLFIPAV